ncbi:MAG: hypothetical protein PWQ77_2117 [Kosmotogales bacterium]|nr:hypothetical protein [Kosmotogales bacterium]
MKKTLLFVGMELRSLKPYRVSILILIVLATGLGFFFGSSHALSSYLMMVLILLMTYPFSISEKNRLDTLYSTLSINRKTVVRGHYSFALMAEAVFIVLAILFSWIMSLFIGAKFDIMETLFSISLLSGVFSLLVAIQFPIYFKYDYSKAKILAFIPLFIVFLGIIQFPLLTELLGIKFPWTDISFVTSDIPAYIFFAPFIFGLVLLWLSCVLSCRLYAKRDI